MKKPLLIILGILIILAVVGVWVYVFTYGAPKNSEEVFARFGFGKDTVVDPNPVVTPSTIEVPDDRDSNASQKLQQLTTRPVAGATFLESNILYVEQGTGHIYSINLEDGTETLVNGTTLAQSAEAVFSSNGLYVAITTYTPSGNSVVIQKTKLEEGDIESVTLPAGAREVTFSKDSRSVMYFLKDATGGSGYLYDLITEKNTSLFTIPLRDVRVLWGTPTYVYTTPSASSVGFMYEIEGGLLSYVAHGGFGLTGLAFDSGVAITKITDSTIQTSVLSKKGGSTNLPVTLIPEKCVTQKTRFYCAVPNTNLDQKTFPDSWYKGTLSYSDVLWSIDTTTGVSTVLSNFLAESGREVDVSKIGIDTEGNRVYFINKNDNTLWLFDMTV